MIRSAAQAMEDAARASLVPPGDPVPAPAAARRTVCVQGLGFVGAAMAVATAAARDAGGEPLFDVIGVELSSERGLAAATALNDGRFPFETSDPELARAASAAGRSGNLRATTDPEAYGLADIVLVDVNFDLDPLEAMEGWDWCDLLDFAPLERAVEAIGGNIAPGTLVIVESTVPPGTCERVIAPLLSRCLEARGLKGSDFLLAHSYERVMPGPGYLRSITDFWRVYAGLTEAAADACEAFLSAVVNVADYPLCRLGSITASETAKVLENSFRAVTIAMIDEWSRFAEVAGIDLYQVIAAIRQRPTHASIREPGFGVGGYCLPKDPLLALGAAHRLFERPDLDFPFSRLAVETNHRMPCAALDMLEGLLDGSLDGKRVLLLGVSYRSGVADTRYAPAEVFVAEAERRGAEVLACDPLVRSWKETGRLVSDRLPSPEALDGLVLGVAHEAFRALDLSAWLGGRRIAVVDAANLLDPAARERLRTEGCAVASLGRGQGL